MRPVVSLDSQITLNEVGGKATGRETEDWTINEAYKPGGGRGSGNLAEEGITTGIVLPAE